MLKALPPEDTRPLLTPPISYLTVLIRSRRTALRSSPAWRLCSLVLCLCVSQEQLDFLWPFCRVVEPGSTRPCAPGRNRQDIQSGELRPKRFVPARHRRPEAQFDQPSPGTRVRGEHCRVSHYFRSPSLSRVLQSAFGLVCAVDKFSSCVHKQVWSAVR